jgi:hypothetical protein
MSGHIAKPIDPALLYDTLSKVARRATKADSADTHLWDGADSATSADLQAVNGLDSADGLRHPLLRRLRAALARINTESPAAATVSPAQTRVIAELLMKLFANFDTSAVTFAEENETSLRPAFDAATWEQFLRQTQQFAFADAQALLDQALARLLFLPKDRLPGRPFRANTPKTLM